LDAIYVVDGRIAREVEVLKLAGSPKSLGVLELLSCNETGVLACFAERSYGRDLWDVGV